MPPPSAKPTRAAIVVGVDRTGDLTPLEGAAKGAKQVGCWLRKDGYQVVELTDADGGKVRFSDVFDAVAALLKQGGLESMVIYFAGHGYFSVGTEIWLLSGAPENASEAVHLEQSKIAASYGSGLKNIVFIADTCRSVPLTVSANAVRGGSIFAMRTLPIQTQIDTFYATLPGDVAVEVAEDQARRNFNGLFTTTLTELHQAAPQGELTTTERDGTPITVLTNRKLRTLLPQEFARKIEELRVVISQTPALKVESDEPFHLACAIAAMSGAGVAPPGVLKVSPKPFSSGAAKAGQLVEAARNLIDRGTISAAPADIGPNDNRKQLQLEREARDHRAAEPEGGFETRCGVLISGSSIVEAATIGKPYAQVESPGQTGNRVRIHRQPNDNSPNDKFGSVAVRFAEGTGIVLAAIPGYLASVIVRDGGVAGVSYAPAPSSPKWKEYAPIKKLAEERRAIAATTARHGIIAMDRNGARKFANLVRVGKGYDPTLGIYAALAYATVGLRKDALSVLHHLQGDLHANLLDVWLFSGADPAERARYPLLPACPMMSQAWDYCVPLGVELHPVFTQAQRRLTLWTTFTSEAMDAILDAAKKGGLR